MALNMFLLVSAANEIDKWIVSDHKPEKLIGGLR